MNLINKRQQHFRKYHHYTALIAAYKWNQSGWSIYEVCRSITIGVCRLWMGGLREDLRSSGTPFLMSTDRMPDSRSPSGLQDVLIMLVNKLIQGLIIWWRESQLIKLNLEEIKLPGQLLKVSIQINMGPRLPQFMTIKNSYKCMKCWKGNRTSILGILLKCPKRGFIN